MKKHEKLALMATLKRLHTEKLNKINATLDHWDHNHRMVKNSYFYSPPNRADNRRWMERKYTFEESVKIGDYTLYYESNRSDTCRHVYWSDELTIQGMDANVSFADIRYLMDAIDVILDIRAKKAAKKNTSADEESVA